MAETLTFRLSSVAPDGTAAARVLSPGDAVTIGRQAGNDLLLEDQRVSRRHAVIVCGASQCEITDLDSSNGTYLGETRLQPNVPVPLQPDVEVHIGSYTLRLRPEQVAAPAEPPPPEAEAPAVTAEAPPPPAESPAASEEGPTGTVAVPEGPDDAARPEAAKPEAAEPAAVAAEPPSGEAPPAPPAPAPGPPTPPIPEGLVPPGLDLRSHRLLGYLPGIYHTDFMARFLGIFESILTPVEWTIDNFDLFLDPGTAPGGFLPWLAGWFDITFDPSWSEAQRRALLRDAHTIYARRGTRWALSRVLEIYTGVAPIIVDDDPSLAPHTFKVTLPRNPGRARPAEFPAGGRPSRDIPSRDIPSRDMVERLIDAHKPAHTAYTLDYEP